MYVNSWPLIITDWVTSAFYFKAGIMALLLTFTPWIHSADNPHWSNNNISQMLVSSGNFISEPPISITTPPETTSIQLSPAVRQQSRAFWAAHGGAPAGTSHVPLSIIKSGGHRGRLTCSGSNILWSFWDGFSPNLWGIWVRNSALDGYGIYGCLYAEFGTVESSSLSMDTLSAHVCFECGPND